jgi:hypothetical protein
MKSVVEAISATSDVSAIFAVIRQFPSDKKIINKR